MSAFGKPVYIGAGYNTTYFGPGRKEFDPSKPMPPFENYLKETAKGTIDQLPTIALDEGIIGSFMSGRFIKQANLPGFLPYMIPELLGKPCTGIEGACGTGGRSIAIGIRSILSGLSNSVFVTAFEMQNTVKSVYGADVLAGASYYTKERKKGHAFFFPALFAERSGAYFKKYGEDLTRRAMAKWYEQNILNARKYPKAQEYHNKNDNLFDLAMTPPNPDAFIPYLNLYNCSKVTDGASSLVIFSEKGLAENKVDKSDVIEVIAIGEAEGDITHDPDDLTALTTTAHAVRKALDMAGLTIHDIAVLEIHDCFAINALLSFEAIGMVKPGHAPAFILEGHTKPGATLPTNLSGGLGGFGHPTGASGVRQMVDLLKQLTRKAENSARLKSAYGMMISMGGNDKTVTCLIVRGGF